MVQTAMHAVDPRFARIARRLTALELQAGQDDDLTAAPNLFVGLYSHAGLMRVLDVYGVAAQLSARGLDGYRVHISREDAFRHRLYVDVDEGPIMDLRLHLQSDAVVVDWLLMQNPRRVFGAGETPLPGQTHPGTGLGRIIGDLLVLLAARLHKTALVTVPERWHLALMYARIGYRCDNDDELDHVLAMERLRTSEAMSVADVAWAIERQKIVDENNEPYIYGPLRMWRSVGKPPVAAGQRTTANRPAWRLTV
jgi:hypothetical protein